MSLAVGSAEQAGHLVSLQNADGGWPYLPGKSSWTEPTVFALLSLRNASRAGGFEFLARCRKQDGGWPPAPGAGESTWVTALAVLLLAEVGRISPGDPAVRWLLARRGRESTLVHRIRAWLMGERSEYDDAAPGWPWTPETAGWVVPTAFSILALRKVQATFPDKTISGRIDEGRRFLIARRCRDLGWNLADSRVRGFHYASFPETTGLALLALQGENVPDLAGSIERARIHARSCRSTQGLCWLYLGLKAHGAAPEGLPEYPLGWRRTIDAALVLLCQEALSGKNVFSAT